MRNIYNAENNMEAQYLCNLLEDAGILAYTQESSSGEYLKITSGMNQVFGTDLFVNDADAEKAKQIIREAVRKKAPDPYDSAARIPWYKNRTILARIILAWAVIMVLVVGILSL